MIIKRSLNVLFYGFIITVFLIPTSISAFKATGTIGTISQVCPEINRDEDLQIQFQILYQSAPQHLVSISPEQSQKINHLININSEILKKIPCFYELVQDSNKIGILMSVVKLQILQIHHSLSKKNLERVELDLIQLKSMMEVFLKKPSQLSRRLGSSIRSLLLDELAVLVDKYPQLVQKLMSTGIWSIEISSVLEIELEDQWKALSKEFLSTQMTSENLAIFFGKRSWVIKEARESLFNSRWNRKEGIVKGESLNSQLLRLFRSNSKKQSNSLSNFKFSETESFIKHYTSIAKSELQKNNYFSLKDWLAPVINEKLNSLKKELGLTWKLISPLAGINIEGDFIEITFPIELLSLIELKKAEQKYASANNPIGRLYEIIFLKALTEIWTTADIIRLRNDYDRIATLKTTIAIKNYQKSYSQWPSSIQELVTQKLLNETPKDHFDGKEIKMSKNLKKVWSVGQNGIDENGRGDDIGLTLLN